MSTATPSLQGGSADICDILESAATEAASLSDKETIQLASCPRAHACLQGVVERQFHPIHLRDFYSVINYLLLRLSLLLRERDSDFANDEGKGGVGGGISAPEVAKLKRQVDELQRKNKERKAKYEEVSTNANLTQFEEFDGIAYKNLLVWGGREREEMWPCVSRIYTIYRY